MIIINKTLNIKYKDLKAWIDGFVSSILDQNNRNKELEEQAKTLKYPAYFDLYDKPYKFKIVGSEIVTTDNYGQNYDIYEALFGGTQISQKEYINMKRRLTR